ncbi:hypothetical protein [Dactylosporangium sp. CA-233914]|uniref:hypothetical protein n=1 Tax=Dactylosporangium sp. CA-233914 TaxID=3239934 RepID=UPI003D9033E2
MSVRILWMAIFLIVGVIAGGIAGILTWLAGAKPAAAMVAGGGGLVATVTLLIIAAGFVAG